MDKKITERWPIATLYILSTFFFLLQHKLALSWDFSAYVLNARYLFYNGTYFEVYRAPLAPIILGIFLIFGKFGEYLFVLLVSTLFLIAILKLSKLIFKKNYHFYTLIFYFFSLSPFVLVNGLDQGTEMLGLSLLILFFVATLSSKISGQYLGLAILTRYNYLIFTPILFFNKDYKKIIKNFFYLTITLFPWLLYNRIKSGNWFTSIIDSYALNVHFRGYLIEPVKISHFYNIVSWLWPFMVIGLIYSIYKISKTKSISKNKIEIIMILTALLVIYDFFTTPLKIERYLFTLSLPIAYFSTIGLIRIIETLKMKKYQKMITLILIIIFSISIFSISLVYYHSQNTARMFKNIGQEINNLNLTHCEILSPHWTPITYYTENVYPLGNNPFEQSIEQNKIIIIIKNERTIDDSFNDLMIEKSPKILETKEYLFIGKENVSEFCSPKYIYNPTVTNKHCDIIASKFQKIKLDNLSKKICELINKPIFN